MLPYAVFRIFLEAVTFAYSYIHRAYCCVSLQGIFIHSATV